MFICGSIYGYTPGYIPWHACACPCIYVHGYPWMYPWVCPWGYPMDASMDISKDIHMCISLDMSLELSMNISRDASMDMPRAICMNYLYAQGYIMVRIHGYIDASHHPWTYPLESALIYSRVYPWMYPCIYPCTVYHLAWVSKVRFNDWSSSSVCSSMPMQNFARLTCRSFWNSLLRQHPRCRPRSIPHFGFRREAWRQALAEQCIPQNE